jgi:integrase/recombinase XerC
VTAPIAPLRRPADVTAAAEAGLAALGRHLDRCKLAGNTRKAYRRQAAAYVAWLGDHADEHPDAFADLAGAEAAVTAWRFQLLAGNAAPASVNQALAAVSLLYEQGPRLRLDIRRARVPRPGEPDALSRAEQGALQRAAGRRGTRDAAIIAVLLEAGARVEECARLDVEDLAFTARAGTVRLHGKGDQVRIVPLPPAARARLSAWLRERGNGPGPLWPGQRGRLTISGITQVVLAAGDDAGLPGLRPHRLRHTYATRLREGGAAAAHIQALLGHDTLNTTARYFNPRESHQTAEDPQVAY